RVRIDSQDKLPSSAEEGWREAPGWCWSSSIAFLFRTFYLRNLNNTTPSALKGSYAPLLDRAAFPSSSEEGSFFQLFSAHDHGRSLTGADVRAGSGTLGSPSNKDFKLE